MKPSLLQQTGSPRARRRIAAAFASLAALGLSFYSYKAALPIARAEAPAPADSVAAGAAASAAAPETPISAYVWPTESSPQPKDDEWAGATTLETVKLSGSGGWTGPPVTCSQRALRDWMRVVCTPEHDGELDSFFGVVWGLAGDLKNVKASFTLASELSRYKNAPTDISGRLTRGMGAAVTLTFQLKPGSSTLLRAEKMFWDEGYDGANIIIHPGMVVDVSWALGEKYPTVRYF